MAGRAFEEECVVDRGPSTEGQTRRLEQGVAWLLHGLGGAYLNQSPVWTIGVKHCYCTAAA